MDRSNRESANAITPEQWKAAFDREACCTVNHGNIEVIPISELGSVTEISDTGLVSDRKASIDGFIAQEAMRNFND